MNRRMRTLLATLSMAATIAVGATVASAQTSRTAVHVGQVISALHRQDPHLTLSTATPSQIGAAVAEVVERMAETDPNAIPALVAAVRRAAPHSHAAIERGVIAGLDNAVADGRITQAQAQRAARSVATRTGVVTTTTRAPGDPRSDLGVEDGRGSEDVRVLFDEPS